MPPRGGRRGRTESGNQGRSRPHHRREHASIHGGPCLALSPGGRGCGRGEGGGRGGGAYHRQRSPSFSLADVLEGQPRPPLSRLDKTAAGGAGVVGRGRGGGQNKTQHRTHANYCRLWSATCTRMRRGDVAAGGAPTVRKCCLGNTSQQTSDRGPRISVGGKKRHKAQEAA